ncbi:TonB-dependent receptor [bacterium]|nr:MAG: TonB-dependent receptor [bacterium]
MKLTTLKSIVQGLGLFLFISVFFSSQVQAQGITTSTLSGIVTDALGEVLPGANIIAIHTPTGTRYGAATSASGEFRIPNVRVGGPYKVTASFIGFQSQTIEGLQLSLGNTERVSFVLQTDDIALEEIVISALGNDNVFNSEKTGAGSNVDPTRIMELPTISRSINDFTRVVPQSNGTSFAGRDNRFNNYTIDGTVYNNNFGLGSAQFAGSNPISLDAIEEIQINLAPYDVRLGSFTGASVNAVTKSGTNEYKASVYNYYRNQDFQGLKIKDTEFTVDDAYNSVFLMFI